MLALVSLFRCSESSFRCGSMVAGWILALLITVRVLVTGVVEVSVLITVWLYF
jgi:hypothetical protein